ncbi:MAG: UDP-N-acetylglucosamine 1-carboxyvinyltransferase [Nitriliruptoraceae bacterium]
MRGGAPLRGAVRVSGAKNSALKLMAAALLTDEPVTISELPMIADVPMMAGVLQGLGVDVTLDQATVTIQARTPQSHAPRDAVMRLRASIACLGPLVGRLGRAQIAFPGGDRIGARTIDLHLRGLELMGATVKENNDEVRVSVDRLNGAMITLDFPSVGATENLMMAAVLADGVTVIENAAREPEIQDLARMLVSMGAHIGGIGTPTIRITGVEALSGTTWVTCPDRIEAGTYMIAAAITGGDIELTNVAPADLTLPFMKLRAAGITITEGVSSVRVSAGQLAATNVVTLPYPGFPTDLQPQMMVLLSQAVGDSRCTENVFESRFSFVNELRALGADITLDGHHAVIHGPTELAGTTLAGLDIRAGAAGVLAGLVASGETVVKDVHHIDRGYAQFVPQLQALGAQIRRVSSKSL